MIKDLDSFTLHFRGQYFHLHAPYTASGSHLFLYTPSISPGCWSFFFSLTSFTMAVHHHHHHQLQIILPFLFDKLAKLIHHIQVRLSIDQLLGFCQQVEPSIFCMFSYHVKNLGNDLCTFLYNYKTMFCVSLLFFTIFASLEFLHIHVLILLHEKYFNLFFDIDYSAKFSSSYFFRNVVIHHINISLQMFIKFPF